MFRYVIPPSFHYKRTQNVIEVVFDISRRHVHTLKLQPRKNSRDAIQVVEAYLNEPITQEYYDMIKDDLPGIQFESMKVRADALAANRLESINSQVTEGGRRLTLVHECKDMSCFCR